MEEKVVRMVIYYVLAVNDIENRTIKDCIEIIKLLITMVKNEETKADRLLNMFPKEHPVSKLYAELREKSSEEIISLFEICEEKFANTSIANGCLRNIEDDSEVEELSKRIAG